MINDIRCSICLSVFSRHTLNPSVTTLNLCKLPLTPYHKSYFACNDRGVGYFLFWFFLSHHEVSPTLVFNWHPVGATRFANPIHQLFFENYYLNLYPRLIPHFLKNKALWSKNRPNFVRFRVFRKVIEVVNYPNPILS